MNLGESIYRHRIAHNLSQNNLADELNVSRQSVSKWENNSAMPELDKLIKMAELFHTSLDELVFGTADVQEKQTADPASPVTPPAFTAIVPMRIIIGFIMLLFGMIFFLLSIFWGNHLYFGEEFGEFTSLVILLISVSLLGTYNMKALTVCALAYVFYSIVCFGILNVTSLTNYLFTFIVSIVIFVWFIVLGLDANAKDT